MKLIVRFAILLPFVFSQAAGQETAEQSTTAERSAYVSDVSFIIGTYAPKARDYSPQALASAAQAFLNGLDANLRERARDDLDSPERRKWTNIPPRPNAGGVRLGDLNKAQVKSFCDLLAALFSQQGYDKMCSIMLADDQLLSSGIARPGFGTESFSVVLFGDPSPTKPWGFQLDGHHVGVNVAIYGDKMTMSPSFIGTQPEAFHLGETQVRPLAGEIDGAFKLVNSLTASQRAKAVISKRRRQIRTGPGKDAQVPKVSGVCCATFNAAQKQALLALISQWIGNLPAEVAEPRMRQIENALDQTYFSWAGPVKAVSDVSFAIQGPSLIIEYACQDLGGKPLNHLHSMYRDPTNEYGAQFP